MRKIVLLMTAGLAVLPWTALAQSELNLTPSRVVGQPSLNFRSGNPNVVDRRSLYNPLGIAVDTSSTPNALFVADTSNNRILGWRNAKQFSNAAPADLILGQIDEQSTQALGPDTPRTVGLTAPGAMAVDSKGNLYVVDGGNNRILRFPKPFESTEDIPTPDMVIGQPNFNSKTSSSQVITERTIGVFVGGTLATSGLAFDKDGNLWFSDALNNRVLRYPKSALDSGANGPAADLVLGEPDFRTNNGPSTNTGATARLNKAVLNRPSGITIDNDGRVYVADAYSRVVVFTPPFSNGKSASRIVGIWIQKPNTPFTTPEYVLTNPDGVFIYQNNLAVVDTGAHRILTYDPYTEWPAETEDVPSPPAKQVTGQQDFNILQVRANRGLAEPNEMSLAQPFAATAVGNEIFVADTGNNRVLVFGGVGPSASAIRLLGQPAFNYAAPNILEGRELFIFAGFSSGTGLADSGGLALDTKSNPPRLYIADTFNNRILCYKDARKVRPGDVADMVIGQNDVTRSLVNAPQNNATIPTNSGLSRPTGLVVDANGDLYVADTGNGRVLRFPSPFQQTIPPGERLRANLVIGQRIFDVSVPDPSRTNMASPFGVALTTEGHLVVSDSVHSRLLFFRRPSGGDFTNGQAAEKVIGQPDFFTVGRFSGANRLFSPRHITIDTDDRLYVTDAGNNRVAIYDRITVAANDPPVAFSITGLTGPEGVYVNPNTGEIWIANTKAGGANLLRFPRFDRLIREIRSDFSIPSAVPLSLAQDSAGNLYVAEGSNRVAIYFNGIRTQVAGSYADIALSPGSVGIVYPRGTAVSFTNQTNAATAVPLPNNISDIQVLLDDKPLPLYFISPGQVNFFVPYDTATSGTAELQVVRAGEILSAGPIQLAPASPALFVSGGNEQGQVAATNPDGSINGPDNQVARGQYITLYGTGLGQVTSPPPAGQAPTGPVNGTEEIKVLINTEILTGGDNIQYFGLTPGLVGVYQVNVKVPMSTAPSVAVPVAVIIRSTPTNRGVGGKILNTTIAVKP